MIFGKIRPDGEISLKDIRVLRLEGRIIVNPDTRLMQSLGYKPLVTVKPPDDYSGALYSKITEQEDCFLEFYENERGERI